MKILTTTLAVLGATLMFAGPAAAAKSWSQCNQEAQYYAVQQTNPGGATVGSAVLGGLLGLGISSVTGNVNTAGNVALGAGIGGVAGFVASNAKQKQLYDSYMASCMGGGQVQPIYAPQPQPGTVYPPPGPQAVVYQSLNVRVCPQASGACPPIGSIPAGSAVPVNSCTTPAYTPQGWCQVGIPAGWGWASKQYLNF